MDAALAIIKESKSADEVFAAVNGFLELDKTDPVFQTLPIAISITSMALHLTTTCSHLATSRACTRSVSRRHVNGCCADSSPDDPSLCFRTSLVQ
jgi:hypothetical protein